MIRKLFPALLAAQTLLATLLWGFPGVWLLAGVPSSFIIAATVAHLRRPRDSGGSGEVRPTVLILGGLFGLAFGAFGGLLMWASTAPEVVRIVATARVDAPRERVWELVGDPRLRTRWSAWMTDLEAIGRGGDLAVGARWRATLLIEKLAVPARVRVTRHAPGTELAWAVEPDGGARFEDMEESVLLSSADEGAVTVDYRLSYRVPGVLGRVAERIVMRRPAERMAEEALKALRAAAVGVP
jgi:carbon monoxide dehydrogenase subunit G